MASDASAVLDDELLNVTMDFPNSKELPAVELCRRLEEFCCCF